MSTLALALLVLGVPPNDTFAPVDIEPPPPRAMVVPPPPTLPSPQSLRPPPPPPVPLTPVWPIDAPPTGNGRVAGGMVLIGLSAITLNIMVAGVDRMHLPSNPPEVSGGFAVLGLGGVVAGTVLIIKGARARKEFDQWRAATPIVMRKDGSGLLAGGSLAMVVGSAALIGAGVGGARNPEFLGYADIKALVGVSTVVTAAGIGFMSWGIVRRKRYVAWARLPMFMPLPVPRGASVDLVGRF